MTEENKKDNINEDGDRTADKQVEAAESRKENSSNAQRTGSDEKPADAEVKTEAEVDGKTEPQDADKADNEAKDVPDSEAEGDGTSDQTQRSENETDKPEEDGDSRYLRLMAEFRNYKKRVAKEKADIHAYANEKLVVELLGVLDNFERALASDPAADAEGYAQGMRLIFDQLLSALSEAGLEELRALGEEFDPKIHNAVMTADDEEYDSNKVCNVLQKGYSLNGKVIRPTMVTVAK